ncbi:hypothetical protein SAMN02910357_01452 [Succinivibrio dextrinosolvens]|nr:hypothetical protein SAMN02910357_01452 [Succinivibrio dextrinosolvens]
MCRVKISLKNVIFIPAFIKRNVSLKVGATFMNFCIILKSKVKKRNLNFTKALLHIKDFHLRGNDYVSIRNYN